MATLESGLPARTLVVPLDGSELSARAVTVAARLAPRLDAHVHLLTVAATQDEAELHRRQFDDVADLVPGASRETIMADERTVTSRDVADAVAEIGTRAGGVVCMASHGRGRSAAVLGSVATEITERQKRPVIVVGPSFSSERWTIDAPVAACVDGTAASEGVVPVALQWARALAVSLSLVTVAEPIPAPLPGRQWRRMHGPDEDADAYMDALLERHRHDRVPVDGTVVYDPVSVTAGLVDHLTDHPASMVAVTTRARTGVPRVIFGSIAADILHQSPVPVLAVAVLHQT